MPDFELLGPFSSEVDLIDLFETLAIQQLIAANTERLDASGLLTFYRNSLRFSDEKVQQQAQMHSIITADGTSDEQAKAFDTKNELRLSQAHEALAADAPIVIGAFQSVYPAEDENGEPIDGDQLDCVTYYFMEKVDPDFGDPILGSNVDLFWEGIFTAPHYGSLTPEQVALIKELYQSQIAADLYYDGGMSRGNQVEQ